MSEKERKNNIIDVKFYFYFFFFLYYFAVDLKINKLLHQPATHTFQDNHNKIMQSMEADRCQIKIYIYTIYKLNLNIIYIISYTLERKIILI